MLSSPWDRCAHYEWSGALITPAVGEKGREGLRSHPKCFQTDVKWILDWGRFRSTWRTGTTVFSNKRGVQVVETVWKPSVPCPSGLLLFPHLSNLETHSAANHEATAELLLNKCWEKVSPNLILPDLVFPFASPPTEDGRKSVFSAWEWERLQAASSSEAREPGGRWRD